MTQLKQLIISPELIPLGVDYMLNDLNNINGKGISQATMYPNFNPPGQKNVISGQAQES